MNLMVRVIKRENLPGTIQSPSGNFALTCIIPYLKVIASFVVILVDSIGGRMLKVAACLTHSSLYGIPVHLNK